MADEPEARFFTVGQLREALANIDPTMPVWVSVDDVTGESTHIALRKVHGQGPFVVLESR